jgi:RNA polymerase-binding transcription factor DksA
MEDRREELIQRRTELIKRIEAIRADVGRGLDNDTEDQAIELENLEVLEEISRIAREELNKVEQELAVLNSKS